MTQAVYSTAALKRAAWQFLTGKAASAVLTFCILLWLVRLLSVTEYGAYAVLIASAELGYAIAGLGLPWLTARFIPEYRLNGSGAALVKLCHRLIHWQMAALIFLSLAIFAVLDPYLSWANLGAHRTAALVALVLLIAEGLARFEREGLLSPLMLQGAIRASTVLRQITLLGVIAALHFSGKVSLEAVISAECAAAIIGAGTAHFYLRRHISGLCHGAGSAEWREPALGAQWKLALPMYAAHLITLATSPQVFLNIVQRTLGAEASALFGFLRTLYSQLVLYLPATLLFNVIRPKLMASFVTGGVQELAGLANLAGKLSLFTLMPIILIVALGGDMLIALLSGGKFQNGGPFLLGLLLVLVPYSQRQLIESVAVATHRAGLCMAASGATLLALPLALILLQFGLGLWVPVLAMLFGQATFNAVVIFGLVGLGYRPDWLGATKLAGMALLAWLPTAIMLTGERATSFSWVSASCAIAVAAYLLVGWWIKPFQETERHSINSLVGRPLFVW